VARELSVSVEVTGTAEADAAISRLATSFTKAGDSALVAAEKAEKFEKAYKDNAARKQAKKELDDLAGATDKNTRSTDALTQAVLRYAAPAAVVSAAQKTLAFADRVNSLSENVKVSAETIQQWGFVAQKSGSSMEAVGAAVQRLGVNVSKGGKPVQEALRDISLSIDDLVALDPEARFRKVAEAIAKIENPARQAHAAQVLLGNSGRDLIKVLEDIAKGVDKNAPAMSNTWVKANAAVKESLDRVLASATNVGMWMIGWAPVLVQKAGEIGDAWHKSFLQKVVGVDDAQVAASLAAATGNIPQAGGGWGLPTPLQAPGLPFGGNTKGVEALLTSGALASIAAQRSTGTGGRGARVLPFVAPTLGSSAAAIFTMANTPGSIGNLSLPFMSSMGSANALNGATFQGFNGVGFAPTVGMNAPGGTSLWSKLSGGKLGAGLGMGMGLLGSLIPGMSSTGSSIGATAGSFLGPLGSGIGSLAGGLFGKLFGGNAKKNAANAEISQVFAQFSSKEFIAIQKEADRLGISMEKALNAKTMKDFGAAVDDVRGKISEMTALEDEIRSLTEAATVDFDKMNAVVKEFGLDVTKLGPAFQQAAVDKEAQRIIDAMAIMEKGGADMNGVLEGMADEISALVQDSIKFGTTIPENMKPWVEKLKESGKLLDENGKEIKDTSQLKFGAPMASEMEKVVKKLDELIVKLGELTQGFKDAGAAAGGLGNVNYPSPSGSGNNESSPDGFATGGVAGRDFRRPGYGDWFPAMLRRGERVLPPGVSGGGVSIGNITVNGSFGSRSDAVEEIGESVVRYIERRGGRLVA
jgi:hypothetical protein